MALELFYNVGSKEDAEAGTLKEQLKRFVSASGLNVLQATVLLGHGPPRRLFETPLLLWKTPPKHSDFHQAKSRLRLPDCVRVVASPLAGL